MIAVIRPALEVQGVASDNRQGKERIGKEAEEDHAGEGDPQTHCAAPGQKKFGEAPRQAPDRRKGIRGGQPGP
jgi:hypothetical protein